MKYTLAFLSILFFLFCKSTKNTVVVKPKPNTPEITDTGKLKKLFELKKGICYGRCPVYTLTVYEGGMLSYQGERFTDKMGLYTKKMDTTAYANLVRAFETTDLWQYPDHIKNDIPDLPSTTLIHYKGTKTKSVQWKNGAAKELLDLAKMMESLAKEKDWKTDPKSNSNQSSNANRIIENEIIVHLEQGVDIGQFVHQFAKQNMKVKKRVAPNLQIWVVQFDTVAASPKDMLKWISSSKGVVKAEFNKAVEMR